MSDKWVIHGAEFANCNCDYGCPCQFNAPSTYGNCQAVVSVLIDEGSFNDIRLDGLSFVILLYWPGEIAEGNGQQQVIINNQADQDQRGALSKIALGESTAPGSTHFFVYNSTMSKVHDTLYMPIDISINVEARVANVTVDGLFKSKGSPIIDPFSGEEHKARIHLPNGFEYIYAEMGSGTSEITSAISFSLSDSYGQFNELHMNQDGVIR